MNRIGFEGKVEYSGNSMCFDPLGRAVIDSGTAEGIFISETKIDEDLVATTRERFPFIGERKAFPWQEGKK